FDVHLSSAANATINGYGDGYVSILFQNAPTLDVDLDIDSDISGLFTGPATDPVERAAEDKIEAKLPGKYIVLNTGDADGDGRPDYADGFTAFTILQSADDASQHFAPI